MQGASKNFWRVFGWDYFNKNITKAEENVFASFVAAGARPLVQKLTVTIAGLPPLETDDARAKILVADLRSLMEKNRNKFIRSVSVEIEFQARSASGYSEPDAIIRAILKSLVKAGAFSSVGLVRDLKFVRISGDKTKYAVTVSEH